MTERREKMVGPISLKAPQSFLDKVDEWRAGQRPIPNRGAAIRLLAEAGLEAVTEKAAKPEKPAKGGKQR
jgi:hypothetical protein